MFDPASTVTLGQVISNLKDGAFIIGIVVLGWKARGIVQPLINFFEASTKHMLVMEQGIILLQTGMNTLLTNHLPHLEQELKAISSRRTRANKIKVISKHNLVDPLLEK